MSITIVSLILSLAALTMTLIPAAMIIHATLAQGRERRKEHEAWKRQVGLQSEAMIRQALNEPEYRLGDSIETVDARRGEKGG